MNIKNIEYSWKSINVISSTQQLMGSTKSIASGLNVTYRTKFKNTNLMFELPHAILSYAVWRAVQNVKSVTLVLKRGLGFGRSEPITSPVTAAVKQRYCQTGMTFTFSFFVMAVHLFLYTTCIKTTETKWLISKWRNASSSLFLCLNRYDKYNFVHTKTDVL